MNIIKSFNIEEKAEMKTISDFALILQHLYGYGLIESMKVANISSEDPLYKALLSRNINLFKETTQE